jgi:hypothetical protein
MINSFFISLQAQNQSCKTVSAGHISHTSDDHHQHFQTSVYKGIFITDGRLATHQMTIINTSDDHHQYQMTIISTFKREITRVSLLPMEDRY